MRKTISIDFDGVIHTQANWVAPACIDGGVNIEALRFIVAALETGWDVVIHSCRFYDLGAVIAVREWMHEQLEPYWRAVDPDRLQYSLMKPRAKIYIDDRGFRYEPGGRFPRLEDIT